MDRQRLASAYAAAKVHALVSWYETTGLASLEAALAGCRIVSTNRGAPPEYLGEHAWYCNPADVSSIRAALEGALAASAPHPLSERILSEYSPDRSARALRQGYERALSMGKPQQPSASSLARLAESWDDLEAAQWQAAEHGRAYLRELEEWVRQRDEAIRWHADKIAALQVHLEEMRNLRVFRLYERFSRSWLYRLYSFFARPKRPR
jgi:hypothetical protein